MYIYISHSLPLGEKWCLVQLIFNSQSRMHAMELVLNDNICKIHSSQPILISLLLGRRLYTQCRYEMGRGKEERRKDGTEGTEGRKEGREGSVKVKETQG